MLHAWHFLTGSLAQLKQVWKHYGIEAAIQRGQITHTPALFVIDPRGKLSRLYMTQMSYTAVPQLGQLLAQSASRAAPRPSSGARRPVVRARAADHAHAPEPRCRESDGGTLQLGPGRAARLYLFFATWDQETSGLAGQLDALNRYQTLAARTGLPQLTAVDEASVEPSSDTVTKFLHGCPHPLSYPVAIDRSGKIADGYQVQGLPWFVLTSRTGQILYYREVSRRGLADHPRPGPLRQSRARSRTQASRHRDRLPRTRRLTTTARGASSPSRAAARRIASAHAPGCAPCAATRS